MEPIVVSVSIETAALERRLGALAEAALAAALGRGLAEAAGYLAGAVVTVSERDGLAARTGSLRRSVGVWPAPGAVDGLQLFVGIPEDAPAAKYAYLLGDEDIHIVPQGHPYLAIPIGENLTGAGVARFASPRQVPGLVFRGLTAGIMVGEEYHAYFALVTDVWIFGRGSLGTAAEEEYGEMVRVAQERVDQLLAE